MFLKFWPISASTFLEKRFLQKKKSVLDEVYISSTKLSTKSERSGSATSTLLALVRHQCFCLTNEIANQYRFFASMERAFPLDTESFRNFKPKFRLNGKPPSILFLTGISEYHCTICVITLVCETMVLFCLAENSHQFFHANGKLSYVSIPFLHQ